MSTVQQIFNQRKLSLQFQYHVPKPLIYPKNGNSIIISTDSDEKYPGIYKYDLDNNTFKLLHTYDDDQFYRAEEHGQFIDYTNHQLCIFGGTVTASLFLDLITKTIRCNLNTFDDYLGGFTSAINIPSTNEQIYIFAPSENNHIIFDCKQQTELEIDVNLSTDLTYGKLLYIESTSELMILGQDKRKDIWKCHIEQKSNQTKYDWKIDNKLKMPHAVIDERDHDVLLYDDIIIVLYFSDKNDNEIWCLDLLHYKWYKSKYNVPKSICSCSYFMKHNNNNDIHLLDFDSQQHFTANIYELFPNDMTKQRRKHYEILVIGFVKDEEKNMFLNIPWPLKQLILLFFPLFGSNS
eukprot:43625_1